MIVFGVVYMILNLVNGKVYIGQTTKDIQVRWKEHLVAARMGKPWTLYTVEFSEGKKAVTFDSTLAASAVAMISGHVKAIVKPGRKEGDWDFLGFVASPSPEGEERDENGDFKF